MSVAGNNKGYTVGLLDSEGRPTGKTWDFPRVTTILDAVVAKPRLMHWFYGKGIEGVGELIDRYGAKLPSDPASIKQLLKEHKLSPYSQRDAAGDRGTDIHAQFQRLCEGETIEKTVDTAGLINWWQHLQLTPDDILATETTLVSFTHRYAGTVDVVYRDPNSGHVVISDLKTGKYVHWTHFLQGEAYRQAWVEDGGVVPDYVTVLHVRPPKGTKGLAKGEITLPDGFKELRAPEVTWDTFLNILEVFRALPLDWDPEEV